MDLGNECIKKFISYLNIYNNILWNGPLGILEKKEFELSSKILLKSLLNKRDKLIIMGGGETNLLVEYYKMKKKVTFISTGGGAILTFLSGQTYKNK